jgi:hypothetical protein
MIPFVTIAPSALPSLLLDERKRLPDVAAIYFMLADDTVPHGRQAVPLDV